MLKREQLLKIIRHCKIWKNDTKNRIKNRIKNNFINKFVHNIIARIKNLHEKLLLTKENTVEESFNKFNRNIYQMFFAWLLDYICVMGISITVIMIIVFNQWYGWRTIFMPIGFGLLVWIIPEIIKKVKEVIRN